jgi:SAM-dependent methyltransferase
VADLESNSFDFVISDAVLEHVGDMDFFMRESKRLLKESGVFYASFGPLWYGPRGDHLNWGPTGMFNHLIGKEKEYEEGLKIFEKSGEGDSIEGVFLVKNKIFSYLKIEEYFSSFMRSGFKPIKILAKISSEAFSFSSLEHISKRLDDRSVPKSDRVCGGFLIWFRPNKE